MQSFTTASTAISNGCRARPRRCRRNAIRKRFFGPLPQLYPFIVNDPGEGTQAKRRTAAVIIDHLTPPLTRAETYGPLKDLEALVDEYYLASGLDRRRLAALKRDILDLTRSHRLDLDAGFTGDADADLQRLDAYLCDLKEAQIRDGLHVLGASPEGRLETDLLVALTRVPRGLGEGGDQSLIRAIAADFGFDGFDPLTCAMAEPWTAPKPKPLQDVSPDPWRTNGDTVERLELYAQFLLSSSRRKPEPMEPGDDSIKDASRGEMGRLSRDDGPKTAEILEKIDREIRPALRACGPMNWRPPQRPRQPFRGPWSLRRADARPRRRAAHRPQLLFPRQSHRADADRLESGT
jgi:cobaltochelatase CobN